MLHSFKLQWILTSLTAAIQLNLPDATTHDSLKKYQKDTWFSMNYINFVVNFYSMKIYDALQTLHIILLVINFHYRS